MAMSMARSALVRIAGRTPRPAASVPKRNFASSSHDDAHETAKWEKITYLGIASCTILAFYNLSKGHPHTEEPPAYPYLHIRNKEFPWVSVEIKVSEFNRGNQSEPIDNMRQAINMHL